MTRLLAAAVIVFALAQGGCGYRTAGSHGLSVLKGVVTLAIPVFASDHRRAGIEGVITNAITGEFTNAVKVVGSPPADAVLEGVVKKYDIKPMSFISHDVVTEYRLTVVLGLRLKNRDGKTLWEDQSYTDYEDFRVDTSDILKTRDAEAAALREIASDTARIIRERILENF